MNDYPERFLGDVLLDSSAMDQLSLSVYQDSILLDSYGMKISDIRDWYYARDPLNEHVSLFDSESGSFPGRHSLQTHDFVQQEAAYLLLVNVFSNFEKREINDPLQRFLRVSYEGSVMNRIQNIINSSNKNSFSTEERDDLMIAADMLSSIRDVGIHFQKPFSPYVSDLPKSSAIDIYRRVLRSSLDVSKLNSTETMKMHRLDKLEAVRQLISLRFSHLDNDNLSLEDVNELTEYLTIIKNELTGEERIQQYGNHSQSTKGFVHETLWMIDSLFLSMVEVDSFIVRPSIKRQDRPEIGRPKLNRGFDFILFSEDGCQLIQLKTSRIKKRSPYHPNITVLREFNFNENDQQLISKKIDSIGSAIKSGLESSLVEEAKRQLLPTVNEAFRLVKGKFVNRDLGHIAIH